MTNPEELQRRFSGPSPTVLIGTFVAVVSVLAAAALLGGPAWNRIKAWRASQFLARSLEFRAQNKPDLAAENAAAAFQLNPTDPEILRLNATVLCETGQEGGLVLWQRLLETKTATLDDRAAFVEAALSLERLDLITPLIADFLSAATPTPRSSRIAAIYCAQSGRIEDAIRHARLAVREAGANPTNVVLLASLLGSQNLPAAQEESRQLFWTLARTNSPFRMPALRELVGPTLGQRTDREQAVALLESLPQRTTEEEVLIAEASMLLDPARTAAIVSNLVARTPRNDAGQLGLVVDALVRTGRHNEVLRLTDAGRGLQNRRLFDARLASLLATAQFEEAYRFSLSSDAPLPPFDLELARIRAAERIEDSKRLESHLRELLRAAGTHPGRLRTVAELAETTDTPTIASEAWRLLSSQPVEASNGLRRLQQLADRKGDTWVARDYARRALRLSPEDPDLRLDVAHYSLLLGEDYDRALLEAERQSASRTNEFKPRAVLALAHLRLGAPDKAKQALDRLALERSGLAPGLVAIVAAAYGLNGFEGKAEELSRSLTLAELRPEERELIKPWLLPTGIDGSLPSPAKRP